MVDPRAEAVLVRSADGGSWEDRTGEVSAYRVEGGQTLMRYGRGRKIYTYSTRRVVILRDPVEIPVTEGAWVEVHRRRIPDATAACRFAGPAGSWVRIFWDSGRGEQHRLVPEAAVRIAEGGAQGPQAAAVLEYLRAVVSALPPGKDGPDPLQRSYQRLTHVHPDSVLARYLAGQTIEADDEACAAPLFPFSSSLSQRAAVEMALRSTVSVIEGPPGTGKTQTILNIIASLVATPGVSVGVVAFSNSAVENVREKLDKAGIGYIVANLGRDEKRKEFFAGQADRNAAVARMLEASHAEAPDPAELREVERRLGELQRGEVKLAGLRRELEAYRLEREHFEQFARAQTLPDLSGLPLLRRSSSTLIGFLAEAAAERSRPRPFGWWRALLRRFRYGPLRGVRPDDAGVALRIQQAFYERRIEELAAEVGAQEGVLQEGDLTGLVEQYRRLSGQMLHASLRERYGREPRVEHGPGTVRADLRRFTADYPVILSTCHSLRGSIGEDQLLDYLIIDEASQADLLTSALALASCRRVVVVGDERQLPPIVNERAAGAAAPPAEPYDYRAHSIMSSLRQLYGDGLPSTMLLEHFRCDPAIIGFCNEKFYNGRLIPLTEAAPADRPMVHVRTSEGNHMRQYRDGGRVNHREIEVILNEVIPELCTGIPAEEIGIATPYRRQVQELTALLGSRDGTRAIDSDTVHKYQGRDKRVMVMSAVLDNTAAGRQGVRFVDESRMVNVAVSRAKERFILVTDQRMLPTSRNLRDLMGYIRYRDPAQLLDSSIVSVFDLLYTTYSSRLRSLAGSLRGEMEHRSEDIVWTVLGGLLEREPYRGLKAVPQVLLRHLVPGTAVLGQREAEFIQRSASLDFVVFNALTRVPLLAIEVDGFAHHADNPVQLARDALKDGILDRIGLPLLRLPTTGSGEPARIVAALDRALG